MDTASQRSKPHWWNVPNQVTATRMVLSIVVFGLIAFQQYLAAFVVFIIAVCTDWVDGYWARIQTSHTGRPHLRSVRG